MENFGSSLPVPSVRELTVTKPLEAVPPRYIRDGENDHYPTAALSDPCLRVPSIDMAKLLNPQYQETELQLLHSACKDWGIFQLINHEVSEESLKSMSREIREFFDLSLEDRKRYAQQPGSLEGYGQVFVISEEQKLEWCDMIFLKALPTHARRLEFWPEHPYNFRETLHSYSVGMKKTAVSTLGFIAMALGLEAKEVSEAFEDGTYDVRMNCYPSCPEPERVIGITSHADNSGITLLTDCGDTPGLQVMKDGHWVFIEPIADAIVVNIGNIIEMMSNGIYKAPYHRAVVNRWKERFSVVTFCYPNKNFVIGPARELTNTGSPVLYKTLLTEDYLQSFYSRKDFSGGPFIDTLKS